MRSRAAGFAASSKQGPVWKLLSISCPSISGYQTAALSNLIPDKAHWEEFRSLRLDNNFRTTHQRAGTNRGTQPR